MTSVAAATSSIGSSTAIPITREADNATATWGVARVACTRPITCGRLASRAIANATREEE